MNLPFSSITIDYIFLNYPWNWNLFHQMAISTWFQQLFGFKRKHFYFSFLFQRVLNQQLLNWLGNIQVDVVILAMPPNQLLLNWQANVQLDVVIFARVPNQRVLNVVAAKTQKRQTTTSKWKKCESSTIYVMYCIYSVSHNFIAPSFLLEIRVIIILGTS